MPVQQVLNTDRDKHGEFGDYVTGVQHDGSESDEQVLSCIQYMDKKQG